MMSRKFLQWLEKQAERQGWGKNTDIAKRTGLKAVYIHQLLKGKRGGDVGIDTFQKIAVHMKKETWEVVWMVEYGIAQMPPLPERKPRRS